MFTSRISSSSSKDKNRIVSAKSICVGSLCFTPNPQRYGIKLSCDSGIPGPNFPFADVHPRRRRADPLQHFPQKSRAVLKTPAILPFSRMRAKKFVPQVPVAMLDVHEVETQLTRHSCRAMKVFNDRTDFAVGQDWIAVRQSQSSIQDRVMIKDARLRPVMCIRTAVASGMRQLQSDEEPLV